MGADTKFYTPLDLTVAQVMTAVEQVLNTKVTHPTSSNGGEYSNFCFDYQGEGRTLWVFRHSLDFRASKPHTSLSLGAWGQSVAIMQALAPLWGGWLLADDCADQEPVYIPAAPDTPAPPVSNDHRLFELAAAHFSCRLADDVTIFLKENRSALLELLAESK